MWVAEGHYSQATRVFRFVHIVFGATPYEWGRTGDERDAARLDAAKGKGKKTRQQQRRLQAME